MLKRDLQSLAPIFALLASTTVVAFGLTQGANVAERLDQTIDAALEQKQIVGTVVLVARDGTIVYHRAAGLSVVILTNTAVAGMIGAFPNSIERAVYGDVEGENAKPVAGK